MVRWGLQELWVKGEQGRTRFGGVALGGYLGRLCVGSVLLLCLSLVGAPAHSAELSGPSPSGIYTATLDNGLLVLMKEVRTAPLFCASVWYRAGAKHESNGTTGLAHLLEHMMFKGTEKYGKGVFDRLLEANGAVNNATTWLDRTNYYILISADKADLAMELEADLMRGALFTEQDLEDEMPVVRNEMDIGQDSAWNELDERLGSMAILEHPYHWPTIGWESDVEAITSAQIREYYDRFYHPNNAYLVLVGDLSAEEMLAKAEHHFGGIPAGGEPMDPVTVEPKQKGERRFLLREAGQNRLLGIAYRTPEATHPDIPKLDMLFRVLASGKSSRLHKALVETGLAVEVDGYTQSFADPYVSTFFVTLAEGADPDAVEDALYAEIEAIKATPPNQGELNRALKQAKVQHYFSLDQLTPLMFAIGEAESMGGYELYETYLDDLAAAQPSELQEAARTYLIADSRTVGFYLPRGEEGGGWIARESDDIGADERSALGRPGPQFRRPPGKDEPVVGGMVLHSATLPTRTELPNGAVLLVQESRENPTVAIRARFQGGLHAEKEGQHGLAALYADVLTRGTASRTAAELAEFMEQNGIQIRFTAGRDAIEMTARSLTEDFPQLIELIGEILGKPRFDPAQIELARTKLHNEIKSDGEDTFLRAYIRGLEELFGPGTPYSRNVSGSAADLDGLQREDLERFHQDMMAASGWTFAVVGDVATEDVARRLRAAIGTVPRGTVDTSDLPVMGTIPKESGVRSTETSSRRFLQVPMKDKSQVDIVCLGEGVAATADNYDAAFLANMILGGSFTSRLNAHLRDDEGLTYGAWSDFVDRDGAFYWLANLGVDPDNVPAALAGIEHVLDSFRNGGISDDEIAKAREYAAGSFPIRLQSKGQVAGTLVEAERLGEGLDYIASFGDRLRAVSDEEVRAAVTKFADPEALVITIAGTFSPADSSPEGE